MSKSRVIGTIGSGRRLSISPAVLRLDPDNLAELDDIHEERKRIDAEWLRLRNEWKTVHAAKREMDARAKSHGYSEKMSIVDRAIETYTPREIFSELCRRITRFCFFKIWR